MKTMCNEKNHSLFLNRCSGVARIFNLVKFKIFVVIFIDHLKFKLFLNFLDISCGGAVAYSALSLATPLNRWIFVDFHK